MTHQANQNVFFRIETGTHSAPIESLLPLAGQSRLLTAGRDKTVRVWDLEGHRLERTLLWQIGPGRVGEFVRMAWRFGRQELFVVTRNVEGDVAYAPWGPVSHSSASYGSEPLSATLRIFDLQTGNQRIAQAGLGWISTLCYSLSLDAIVVVDSVSRQLRLFDVEALLLPDARPRLTCEPLAGEPRRLAVIERDAQPRLVVGAWGEAGAVTLHDIEPQGFALRRKLDLPDGDRAGRIAVGTRHLAIAGLYQPRVYLYDFDLEPVRSPLVVGCKPAELAFAADDRLIVGTSDDECGAPVLVFDGQSDYSPRAVYSQHGGAAEAVGFLDDGLAVSAGGPGNDLHVWHDDGRFGETQWWVRGVGRKIYAVGALANDEHAPPVVALGNTAPDHAGNAAPLELRFDLSISSVAPLPVTGASPFQRAVVERDGQRLVVEQGRVILQPQGFPIDEVGGERSDVRTFGFLPDGRVVTGDNNGTLFIAGPPAAVPPSGPSAPDHCALRGHEAGLRDHAVAGDWLITGGIDQVLRLWYLPDLADLAAATRQPALNLFVGANDEWVLWSEHGFFDASAGGDCHVGYHLNQGDAQEAQFVPNDRFVRHLYRPSLIRAILATGSEQRALAFSGLVLPDLQALLPPVVEVHGLTFSDFEESFVPLDIEVRPGGSPVRRVWVICNDVLVWEDAVNRPDAHTFQSVKVPLTAGENLVRVLAEGNGAKSTPVILHLRRHTPPEQAIAAQAAPGDTSAAPSAMMPIALPVPDRPPQAVAVPGVLGLLRGRRLTIEFVLSADAPARLPIHLRREGRKIRTELHRRGRHVRITVPLHRTPRQFEVWAGRGAAAVPVYAFEVRPDAQPQPVARAKQTTPAVPRNAARATDAPAPTALAAPADNNDRPHLFILAIGVSKIQKPSGPYQPLRFAAADAVSISETLVKQRGGLFGATRVWLLTDEHATLSGIRAALDELRAAVAERGARPGGSRSNRDVTVIALAGHGVQTRDDRFFFWNHDFDFDQPAETGLDFLTLGDIVTAFPTELVMLIDACHAGLAGAAAVSNLRPEEMFKRLMAINERAQTIFSATQKNELALEHEPFGHGLFTKAILDTMEQNPAGAEVSVLQLIDNTQRIVRGWSDGRQVPSVRVYGDLFRLVVFRK
ncbi:MAG: caspase family protein [Thermoflexales bacterium]|nr:caspase family protein [Thermoflexales bacterium]